MRGGSRAGARRARAQLGIVRLTAILAGSAVLGASVRAAQPPASRAGNPAPEVSVRTVEDEALLGQLLELDPVAGLLLRQPGREDRRIRLPDLIQMQFSAATSPPAAAGWRLRLHNGDRLEGWPTEVVEDVVALQSRDLGLLHVPLDWVSVIETGVPFPPTPAQKLEELIHGPAPADRVLLSNGDIFSGFVSQIDADAFTLQSDGSDLRLRRDVVVAVRFVDTPLSAPAGPAFKVDVADGGRVTLESVTLHGGVFRGLAPFGQELRIHSDRIRTMLWTGGRWTWLTELEPVSTTQTPMLALDWPVRENLNVRGGPLRVAEVGYEQGLGVHSRCLLAYDLAGEYSAFVASFGLDDDSGASGDVRVSVIVDDKVRYEQEHVKRGKLFGPVRIDLAAARGSGERRSDAPERRESGPPVPDAPSAASPFAKRLLLLVDFGDNGDIQDRFDWIEAGLVRR